MSDYILYEDMKAKYNSSLGFGSFGVVKKYFHIESCSFVAIKQQRSAKFFLFLFLKKLNQEFEKKNK